RAAFGLLAYFINSYYSGVFIDYGVFDQVKDIWKFVFVSLLMGGAIWGGFSYVALVDLLTLIFGIVIWAVVYIGLVYQVEKEMMYYSINTIKEFISRRR